MPISTRRIVPLVAASLGALALVLVSGCSSSAVSAGPDDCALAPDTTTQSHEAAWEDPAVADPRPPPLNAFQPTPTFGLNLFMQRTPSGEWWVLPNSGSLWSSDGSDLALEAGPSMGRMDCSGDPEAFVADISYIMRHAPARTERIEARLVGGHLVGTITIEGYSTTFDAAPR